MHLVFKLNESTEGVELTSKDKPLFLQYGTLDILNKY